MFSWSWYGNTKIHMEIATINLQDAKRRIQRHLSVYVQSHMRMFNCLLEVLNDFANLRTESRELVSISKTWYFASGCCSSRLSFTFKPVSSVRAGMITFAPLKASTRAVSFPMPLVAPNQHASIRRILQHVDRI